MISIIHYTCFRFLFPHFLLRFSCVYQNPDQDFKYLYQSNWNIWQLAMKMLNTGYDWVYDRTFMPYFYFYFYFMIEQFFLMYCKFFCQKESLLTYFMKLARWQKGYLWRTVSMVTFLLTTWLPLWLALSHYWGDSLIH